VVLKVIAANPSKEMTQKVPVKAFLPKEVKPEDIIDKGDLDMAYDTQQGSYYVYGEYEVKPGEMMTFDIELRDIWEIPDNDIEVLRKDVTKSAELLKNSEFGDRVAYIKEGIEAKLNQVIENQKAAPANPAQHISNYRDNLALLEESKRDLALLRGFVAQMKPMPTAAVWRLILAIVIFLGVLGAAFYIIWQKQVKTITQDDTFFVPKEEEAEGVAPTKHEEGEKKPTGT